MLSGPMSEITSHTPNLLPTPPLQLYWLFAKLGTVHHYLQSLELFARLVPACATIWRTWHCWSLLEFGFIYRVLLLLGEAYTVRVLFVVLVTVSAGVVMPTEPIRPGSSVC